MRNIIVVLMSMALICCGNERSRSGGVNGPDSGQQTGGSGQSFNGTGSQSTGGISAGTGGKGSQGGVTNNQTGGQNNGGKTTGMAGGGTAGANTTGTNNTGTNNTGTGGSAVSCQPPNAACGNICTDLRKDVKNCGGCGLYCKQGQVCNFGKCQKPPENCQRDGCSKGYYCNKATNKCSLGCIDNSGCKTDGTEWCDTYSKTCECSRGYDRCGGVCKRTDTVDSCGVGCKACPKISNGTMACVDGECKVTSCDPGLYNCGRSCKKCCDSYDCGKENQCCGGKCVPKKDVNRCGDCITNCGATQQCNRVNKMAIYRCCPKGDCVSNFTTTGATGVKHSCVKNGYFHRPSETGKTYKFSYVYQCKDGAWSSQYVRNMTSCPPNYCKFGFFCYNSGFCRYGDAGVVKCNPNDPVRGPWVKVTSTRSCSYKEF